VAPSPAAASAPAPASEAAVPAPQAGDAAGEPPDAPPAPPEGGTLSIGGDAAAVRLVGATGSFGAGTVPPGTYTLMVEFDAGTPPVPQGSITVPAGGKVQVTCKASFLRCRMQ
ncbi:MAG: hypothetical protein VX000_12270, partial [Myxococcota bacterium]|nr:hypothetical protein [Myxococcota bacterium]